ncbi:hypothetical protein [Haloplanus halobius]|uniref:transcriptional regulator FilR1 domain-containing protein n=1 Tax=Haloplanus halobius TaxID=2934938 RepID=UPI00200FEEBD|nr:hypothetical protein [Haloplanus sp. XH21]
MSESPFENDYELMEFLFGTPNRTYAFLEFYQGEEEQEYLPDIKINRSTKSTQLGKLEKRGLLNKISRGNYELTPTGEIAIEHMHNWMKDAHIINRLFPLTPFLRQISNFDEFLDQNELEYLANARIEVQSEDSGRNHAKRLYHEMIDEASEIREVIHRTYDPEYVRKQLVSGELDSIHVVSSIDMEKAVRNDEEAFKRWKEMYANGSTHITVSEEIPTDYSITIFDGEIVGILTTDVDQGAPDVYLVSSNEDVVNWASNLVDRYTEKGEESVPVENDR